MFRKKKTRIGGIEIPERDANVISIINDVVIYDDNTYVTVEKGRLIEAEIPADGILDVGGTTISISPSGISVQGGNISVKSLRGKSLSVGGVTIGGTVTSGVRGYEIDELYQVASGDVIEVDNNREKIALALHSGKKVRIEGEVAKEPKCRSGRLSVEGLNGQIYMPKDISDLELKLKTVRGSIRGDVMHPGRIYTVRGNIELNLYAPFAVEPSTVRGKIDVREMLSKGSWYAPANEDVQGSLSLSTTRGNIVVNYVAGLRKNVSERWEKARGKRKGSWEDNYQ